LSSGLSLMPFPTISSFSGYYHAWVQCLSLKFTTQWQSLVPV